MKHPTRLIGIETVSFQLLDDKPLTLHHFASRFDAALGFRRERLHHLWVGAITPLSFLGELSALFAQRLVLLSQPRVLFFIVPAMRSIGFEIFYRHG